MDGWIEWLIGRVTDGCILQNKHSQFHGSVEEYRMQLCWGRRNVSEYRNQTTDREQSEEIGNVYLLHGVGPATGKCLPHGALFIRAMARDGQSEDLVK